MKTTTVSLAKSLGISQATVSLALRDSPLVNTRTKLRVKQAARARNYVPNRIAQAMRMKRTSTVGIIVPTIRDSFHSHLVDAVESVAKERGYQCLLYQSHSDPDTMARGIRTLVEHQVGGLIIQPINPSAQLDLYRWLIDYSVPTVLIGQDLEGVSLRRILTDDEMVGRLATEHLIERGHRRIAFIQGPAEATTAKGRYSGYCAALKAAGISLDESLVFPGRYLVADGERTVRELLKRQAGATALVASNDDQALGAIRALAIAGKSVPRDMSVVGSGNSDLSRCTIPALTTVDQRPLEQGSQAVSALLSQVEGKPTMQERTLVRPRLVQRESVTRLPKPSGVGFTLIELLVVVAIISLLVSILLPSLAKARQAAQTVVCANNLKQLGISVNMYHQEHDGWLPDANRWGRDLYPYVGSTPTWVGDKVIPLYTCPSDKDDVFWVGSPLRISPFAAFFGNYAAVTTVIGRNDMVPPSTEGLRKISDIQGAIGEKIIMVDSTNNNDILAPWTTSWFDLGYGGCMARRHRGGANFLFLDGHVTVIKEIDFDDARFYYDR